MQRNRPKEGGGGNRRVTNRRGGGSCVIVSQEGESGNFLMTLRGRCGIARRWRIDSTKEDKEQETIPRRVFALVSIREGGEAHRNRSTCQESGANLDPEKGLMSIVRVLEKTRSYGKKPEEPLGCALKRKYRGWGDPVEGRAALRKGH